MQCAVDFGMSSCFAKASSECKDFILLLLQRVEGKRPTAMEASRTRWLCGDHRSNLPILMPPGANRSRRRSASNRPSSAESHRATHALRQSLTVGASTLQMGDAEVPRTRASGRPSLPAGWALESDGCDTSKGCGRRLATSTGASPMKTTITQQKASALPSRWQNLARRSSRTVADGRHKKIERRDSQFEDPATFPRLRAIQPPPPARCKYSFCWDSKVAWAAVGQRTAQASST